MLRLFHTCEANANTGGLRELQFGDREYYFWLEILFDRSLIAVKDWLFPNALG